MSANQGLPGFLWQFQPQPQNRAIFGSQVAASILLLTSILAHRR
jgi:hypothetical protein